MSLEAMSLEAMSLEAMSECHVSTSRLEGMSQSMWLNPAAASLPRSAYTGNLTGAVALPRNSSDLG
jgi:hypothetical protein